MAGSDTERLQTCTSLGMKVLIATDGSSAATNALRTATRLLSPIDRNLDILSVAPRYRAREKDARREDYERRILRETTQILTQAKSHLTGDGAVNLIAEIGSPSSVLVQRAEDYDLTVVGAQGQGVTGELGLGPVASRVVEHAMGPVLVGRELQSEGPIRILAAVDGSAASLHAIEDLGRFFDLQEAEVCLMHVAETPWVQLGLQQEWATYSEEDKEQSEAGKMEKELVREGELVIDQARKLLRPSRVSISTVIEEGDPALKILNEAERGEYDLIAVGATGARDLKHGMLGSVSAKIAWDATCSVLIVRQPDGGGEAGR
jgi:nucleotide-binding universal stress UspA family protein